ncbi:D-tyrosyl-tRNA(Tyr) deacylase [Pseudoalteromonas sp. SR43-6]|jgi:D-tyrosyl-tRNA(Tyr) deacylase|uniref:D-aminoacyl-tRNA deacylase n=1 Tax=Pseudoalteromonas distincta TaxID=77608 RepID=A0A4P9J4M6_9GAMM|nr:MULTISPECIES: D-aminoacyl-tRNA deacylase [Pseudoalteromonas]KAA1150748.1 D-tyrosyl-tRNA(Tyr) deacylase [Pseudoalteromonas sp. FUC4]MBB1281258.1 D-tyrosyl-tRNA(Tyr) deacylase [Pseudoalteromonas sp. SR41-1]MBB1290031.1 D-tyrosyl-tRNA(Tyr) deacylase [Pseudoalteromonas sp. SR41-5]MBB1298496.1 D-tyrosyl-tRNA(Tyr) deacylase [Pseudoalteromonas sp. SR41-7]MBB1307149.1 D-tyrosyl-tRNA(Tyr) deacylase [Pseudoalteromonas sp. SR43-5]|tara:strand:+ start:45411 stop:45848 length:438 start_codon:yes stop_codon:yes gene_type:complete
MQGLIQRVKHAKVEINNQVVGEISQGILLLLGVEKHDDTQTADKLLHKVSNYRIFTDENDKMNLSLKDIKGELLVVSQFTLAADTKKGMRPSFSSAATPSQANELYEYFVAQAKELGLTIATGEFGADMQVSLCNDGPVTFNLSV